jgi:hypothetical protein
MITSLQEIRPHAIGQYACFSDVNDFTPSALHQIDAGLIGQMVKFGLKVGSNGHGISIEAISCQLLRYHTALAEYQGEGDVARCKAACELKPEAYRFHPPRPKRAKTRFFPRGVC